MILLAFHKFRGAHNAAALNAFAGQVLQEPGLGVLEIVAGLGGSRSTDGGIGAAEALGFRFLNDAGRQWRIRFAG